jgi:hypothetical protein
VRALHILAAERVDLVLFPIVLDAEEYATATEVLYELIRGIHEGLDEAGGLDLLDERTRETLELAYARTSGTRTLARSSSVERSRALGLGTSIPGLSDMSPKAELARKTSHVEHRQDVFGEYREADVRRDLRRIISGLAQAEPFPDDTPAWSRARRRRSPTRPRFHIVVVIQGLDELEHRDHTLGSALAIIDSLRKLVALPYAHFIFLGGSELHQRVTKDRWQPDRPLTNVFEWEGYVPLLWNLASDLLDFVIAEPQAARGEVRDVSDHLTFWGRGRPRWIFRELESLVSWHDDQALLTLDMKTSQRVAFYAALQRVVEAFSSDHHDGARDASEEDRWRLGVLATIDRILRSREDFTVDDLLAVGEDSGINPTSFLSVHQIDELMAHLVACGVPESVRSPAPSPSGPNRRTRSPRYRVVPVISATLRAVEPL